MSSRSHRDCRAGLSAFEVVTSTLIVGVVVVAALNGVGAVYQSQHLNAERLTGPNLAHDLMAEVLAMAYVDPDVEDEGSLDTLLNGILDLSLGTEVGESTTTREDFDDVDDYDGWDEPRPADKEGNVYSGFAGWRRQVTVDWVNVTNGAADNNETGLKRIRVTVTSPQGEQIALVGYRSFEGMLEQAPALETTVVNWMGAELVLGNSSQAARAGTYLSNHAADVD